MMRLWQLIYNLLLLPLLIITGSIAALFNQKIREGFIGRWKTKSILKTFINEVGKNQLIYWFHSASHGEFEQIHPVLTGLKEVEPNCKCIVSFFSPSGFKNVNDPNIDCKVYLPVDLYWTCHRILKMVRPYKLIFAEYDVWPNYVWCAKNLGIKTVLFSARIRKKSKKLYPVIRGLYKYVYKSIDSIYTVSEHDHINIQRLVGKRKGSVIRVLGSPRYDRVKELADRPIPERTKAVLDRDNRLIAGSVRPEDESVILPFVSELLKEHPELSLYWVPHEPSEKNISRSIKYFDECNIPFKRFSENKSHNSNDSRVMIIDKVGVLSELYWYGRYAYVGGAFSSGIHNVMEPAIARLPVIFGPKYHNSSAAEEMLSAGGGFSIKSGEEFRTAMEVLLDNTELFLEASTSATSVIHNNVGSATRVVRGILRD